MSKHTNKLRVKEVNTKGTLWITPAGEHIHSKTKAWFTIPELQYKKLVKWTFHVTKDMGAYDMIKGRDIQFSVQQVRWECTSMPFKPVDAVLHTDYHIHLTGQWW